MSLSTNCSKGGDIISVSAWKKRYSVMRHPVFKIFLQHSCAVLQGSVGSFRRGGLISIIAFNIFYYPYLIFLEHDTKEQFDCEQVQNKLFLLIIPGFNSLFIMHWIHKKQRWWWERGFTRHLMGGSSNGRLFHIYYTWFGHWEGLIKSKKWGTLSHGRIWLDIITVRTTKLRISSINRLIQ